MKTDRLPNLLTTRATTLKATGSLANGSGVLVRDILLPIDFSARSKATLDYAVRLIQTAGAALHLVHVIEPVPFFSGLESIPITIHPGEVIEHCARELSHWAREASAPGRVVTSEVLTGYPITEISNLIRAKKPDLMIISTHGRTGLPHLLLGSMAEKLIRKAICPIIIRRDASQDIETTGEPLFFRRILVATDFSPRSIASARYAARFARQFGGKLTLVHCYNGGNLPYGAQYAEFDLETVTQLCRDAAEQHISNLRRRDGVDLIEKVEILEGPPLAVIPEYAKSEGADLIVCATHGYAGLTRALLGSTAEGIVRHAPCSVLVVSAKAGRLSSEKDRAQRTFPLLSRRI